MRLKIREQLQSSRRHLWGVLEIKKLVVAHIHNPVVVERVDLVHSNAIRSVVKDRFKPQREEQSSKKQWKLGEIMNSGVDQCCLQT
jgi:hypothetical protein